RGRRTRCSLPIPPSSGSTTWARGGSTGASRRRIDLDRSVRIPRVALVARVKEFDRDGALDKAMCVFWTKGYEATSLGDLLSAMGIARQSLYDTFGDKRALFGEALARYQQSRGDSLRAVLDGAPSVRRAIRE